MPLQTEIQKLEDVAKIYHDDYIPIDPNDHSKGYRLLVEGPNTTPEERRANDKLREFRKTNTEAFAERDRLKAENLALQEALAKLQTAPASPSSPTNPADTSDASFKQKLAEALAPYQEEQKKAQKALADRARQLEEEKQKLEERLTTTSKSSLLRDALGEAGMHLVNDVAYKMLEAQLMPSIVFDDGKCHIVDPETRRVRYSAKNSGEDMTIHELVAEAAEKVSYLFVPGRGGGASGSFTGSSSARGNNSMLINSSIPKSNDAIMRNLEAVASGKVKVVDRGGR